MAEHEEIVDEYAEWMRSWGASPQTISLRTMIAESRIRAWGHPADWTPDQVQTWLAQPKKDGAPRARATQSTYHTSLSSFFEWLVAADHVEQSPMDAVRRARPKKALPRPLSDAEVNLVLTHAKGDVRAWILLSLLAGLRAHEIAKIRGEDVTQASIYVLGKGGVAATIPTHPDLWMLAQSYPRTGYWFGARKGEHASSRTVTVNVTALFREVGITTGSLHRCRHTFATRLLRSGANIRKVQTLMRHASLATTAIYTAVDDDELRDAVNLLTA